MSRLALNIEKMQKADKKVIGCFPLYPPVELLHSLGLVPVVLWDLKNQVENTTQSDKHLQRYTCSVARCLTQFLLEDKKPQLNGLLMYNACDTLRNLPEIITDEMINGGYDVPFFKLHIPAVHVEQTDSSQYLKNRIGTLIMELEECFNVQFSGEQFKKSVSLYSEMRSLCKQAERLVEEGNLSFSEFNILCCMGYKMSVEDHIEKIRHLVDKQQEDDSLVSGNVPVIISGILSPSNPIIEEIERSGLRIAGNDIATLYRSYGYNPRLTDDPEEYYTDFYQNHIPCTTILPSSDQRIDMLMELVHTKKARGVIFIGEKYCEHEYFEFPYLEKRFKAEGVKTLQLECPMGNDENIGVFKTRIETFAEILNTN